MSSSFSFVNIRHFDTSKTTPGSGATWNLVRRTFSLIYQLPPPASRLPSVDGVPKQNNSNLMSWLGYRIWFRKAQGERRRFETTRAEPEMWVDVDVWSDGLFKFLSGWVWAGDLKHGVYVVLLSATDCVRSYWLSKQDFFGIYLFPHSTYLRDFETKRVTRSHRYSIRHLGFVSNFERWGSDWNSGNALWIGNGMPRTTLLDQWLCFLPPILRRNRLINPPAMLCMFHPFPAEWVLPLPVLWIRLHN